MDTYMNQGVALLLQACRVLDPEAGSLVGEVWNEGVSAFELPELEAMYQRAICNAPVLDKDGGESTCWRSSTNIQHRSRRPWRTIGNGPRSRPSWPRTSPQST